MRHYLRVSAAPPSRSESDAGPRHNPTPLARLITTHHKTGTALMHDIFKTIARNFSRYGDFANIRDMEDHPDQFTAADKARAASAGIVLDYHLGKQLPDFLLTDLTSKAMHQASDGKWSSGELSGKVAEAGGKAIQGSEKAAGDADEETVAAARECTSLPSLFAPADKTNYRRLERLGIPYIRKRGSGGAYRMVHVVRDPVEVLISGFLYHRRRPIDEQWLFRPVKELSGKTYADHLSAVTPEQAMMAEIGMADDELRMLALAYRDVERDPNAINVQLEDFFHRFDETVLRVLRFLRFDEEDIPAMAEAAKEFDMRRWSKEELQANEHFTQSENRTPYIDAIRQQHFLNKTMSYMRYAIGYDERFPVIDR